MGAEYIDMTLDNMSTSDLKKAFKERQEQDNAYNGHQDGYSGDFQTVSDLRIKDIIFESFDEASDYCSENAQKWDFALAVKYKEYPETPKSNSAKYLSGLSSKKLATLKSRLTKEKESYSKLSNKITSGFKNRKSKLISCKNCDSKINKDFISTQSPYDINCKVCNRSLLSDTDLKRLENFNDKIRKLEKDFKDEETKLKKKSQKSKKATVKWYVGAWAAC